ncbi:hypothetical protein KCU64_g23593, partial [Aureobasidium melanogenum]
MDVQSLESRFEGISVNDENHDQNSHKSKGSISISSLGAAAAANRLKLPLQKLPANAAKNSLYSANG